MLPLRDNVRSRTVPFVNYAIIFLNVACFIAQMRWSARLAEGDFQIRMLQLGLVPGFVFQPEVLNDLYDGLERA